MTPELIVHHPVPDDLRILLEAFGYKSGRTTSSSTSFIWQPARMEDLNAYAPEGGGTNG